jgi:hypothetical protein
VEDKEHDPNVIKTPDGLSDMVRGINAADELEASERLQRRAQEERAEEQDDDTDAVQDGE